VETSPIRAPKGLIALALLPLLEPLALAVALSGASPSVGALANQWLALAPFARWGAFLTGGVAVVVVIRRFLRGFPVGKDRTWGLLIGVSFLSLMSIGTLDPAEARAAAYRRAHRESDRVAQAIAAYAWEKGHAPDRLEDLTPAYLRSPADPDIAGSRMRYERQPGSSHGYELVVPCPGQRTPFVRRAYQGSWLDGFLSARAMRG
jgi:hypothetical protein